MGRLSPIRFRGCPSIDAIGTSDWIKFEPRWTAGTGRRVRLSHGCMQTSTAAYGRRLSSRYERNWSILEQRK
jgi:hypothetical protein